MRYRDCCTMRMFIRQFLLFVLLTKTCYVNLASTSSSLDDAQKSSLGRVVSEMIGVNAGDVERRGGRRRSAVEVQRGRSRLPPRYIYRLYERYRSGYVVHSADTVRSVNAELALVQNSLLYVFDVTSIRLQSEDVVYSELHVYKRRRWSRLSNRSPRFPDVDVSVGVYELRPSSLVQRSSLTVSKRSAGWQTLNVTDVVRACVNRSTSPTMIAVSFADMLLSSASDKERAMMTSTLRFSSFRRRFSRPLLVVYSRQKPDDLDSDEEQDHHEDILQNIGTLEENVKAAWEETVGKVVQRRRQKTVNNEELDRKKYRKGNRKATRVGRRRQHLVEKSTEQEVTSLHQRITGQRLLNSSTAGDESRRRDEQTYRWQNQGNSSSADATSGDLKYNIQNRMTIPDATNVLRRAQRTKRGILDNKVDVPEEVIGQTDHDPAPVFFDPLHTSSSLLHGHMSYQKLRSTEGSIYTKYEDADQLSDSFFDADDRKNKNARGKRRKNRARGRRRKESSLMAMLRNPDVHFNDRQMSVAAEDSCKKKRLLVNFADIGWSDWIIAPDYFDAFYCDGFCSFPISRKLRPTNHATIQSIMRAVDDQTDVPSPCCVPASLTSLTLLYFDQQDNVVLKNYPEMSVRSCACR